MLLLFLIITILYFIDFGIIDGTEFLPDLASVTASHTGLLIFITIHLNILI